MYKEQIVTLCTLGMSIILKTLSRILKNIYTYLNISFKISDRYLKLNFEWFLEYDD